MEDILLREDRGRRCTLTLNRPDKRNALNTALFQRLNDELARLEQQTEEIGCVVLRGAGRAFCAGADLGALQDGSAATTDPAFKPAVIDRLARMPIPIIAAVHGDCLTGGLELALAADFILASTAARFADTHGKWGLIGGWGITQRLPRKIGAAQAKLLSYTSDFCSAEKACAIGIADILAPAAQFEAELEKLVAAILANSQCSNSETKKLINDTLDLPLAEGLAIERQRCGKTADFEKRLQAFGKSK
jgi:enoyl-CoA hydratase/carnithine racemase